MFDTKISIVLRDDLEPWQALNVTAFLTTGIVAQYPEIIGEPYRDASDNTYNSLSVQPVVILAANAETIANIHQRCLNRGVRCSAYVEEMFATNHDRANRGVFRQFSPETANVVGIALRDRKNVVDKITKGAHMHP